MAITAPSDATTCPRITGAIRGIIEWLGRSFTETEWDPRTLVEETRWFHELAEREGLPSVMIAQARLDQPDVDKVLEAHCTYPRARGIRHHTGLPADRSEAGLRDWRNAMSAMAKQPNVAVKISGIGVPDSPWTAEMNRRVVLETIDCFGVERCMFVSNFPVDGLVASLSTIFNGFLDITSPFTEVERRKICRIMPLESTV